MEGYYNEIGFRLARSQTVFIKSAISSPPFHSPSFSFAHSFFLALFPPTPFLVVFYYYSQLANPATLFSADG